LVTSRQTIGFSATHSTFLSLATMVVPKEHQMKPSLYQHIQIVVCYESDSFAEALSRESNDGKTETSVGETLIERCGWV
jgi:hypothetical protein